MRDFITKLAKPIITLILAIAAIVFAGLYEILCVSISKNYTSIGIIVCFVLLLAGLAFAIIKKNKVAVLGIFTFLSGFIAIYRTIEAINYIQMANQCFDFDEAFEGFSDLLVAFADIAFTVGAFSYMIGKYILTKNKEVAVDIAIWGFIACGILAILSLIFLACSNYYGSDYTWYIVFNDIFRVLLPFVFLFAGAMGKKVTE